MVASLMAFKRRRLRGLLTQQYFSELSEDNTVTFSTDIEKAIGAQSYSQPQQSPVSSPVETIPTMSYKKYITDSDFLQAYNGSGGKARKIPDNLSGNMRHLIQSTNKVLSAVSNDLPDSFKIEITSGYRTMQEHERIYAAEHPGQKIPYHSAHLTAQALDIRDTNGILKKAIWKNKNVVAKIMEKEGLSFESFNITNGWVHIQTKPLAAHGNQMWNFEDFQNARYQPMQ